MDPRQIAELENEIRSRARAIDQKRKSIGPEKNRISMGSDIALKLGAGALDLLGIIINIVVPAVGGVAITIINVGGNALLILAYLVLRVKPISGKVARKTVIARVGCFFAELIPIINALPAFSLGVWYTNFLVRKEDREYNKGIRNALKEIALEERSLQYDMQRYAQLVQEYEQMQQAYEEETLINQINEEDDEERSMAA